MRVHSNKKKAVISRAGTRRPATISRRWQQRLHVGWYVGLFGLLAISLGVFGLAAARYGLVLWDQFRAVYLGALLVYTWYVFFLLFVSEARPRRQPAYAGGRIVVVMPCYNEPPESLLAAIESVLAADGDTRLVIVNDGSTNGVRALLDEVAARLPVTVHHFAENQGKRAALHYAVTHLVGEADYVVTVDSDAVVDTEALTRVVAPLQENDVGAATGYVRISNEKAGWLPRMVAAYYWVSLNMHRQAQSVLGIVDCCSGVLAAYRRTVLVELMDEVVTQRFLGAQCVVSEDRHLTNLVLREGYKVVFVPEACVATESPATVRGFIRQQLRWKRGYFREATYTLSYAWQNNKVLFAQVLLWDLTSPFLALCLRLVLLLSLFVQPTFFLFFILPSWLLFLVTRNVLLVLRSQQRLPGLLTYVVFYEAVLYWLGIYALFSVRGKRWLTR